MDVESWYACFGSLPFLDRKKSRDKPLLVQEAAGFYLGISPEIKATGRHAAQVALEKYEAWLTGSKHRG